MSNIKQNKKGLSQIIAMVIFILLSISAIGILIPSIRNIAQAPEEPLLSVTSCIQLQQSPSTIESTRYNEGILEIVVKRSSINEIESFDFVLETESQSSRFKCGPSCGGACNIQSPGQEKTFYFEIQNIQNVKFLVNGDCEMDEKAVF